MSEVRIPPSAEPHFDLAEGKLIIGSAAFEDAIESGFHPDDIHSLGALLTQRERPVDPNQFDSVEYKDWDQTNDVPIAKWLHAVMQQPQSNESSSLSEEGLVRAGYLGLIPRIHYFKKRPGGVQGLYAEAELSGVKMRGYFDTWSKQDYIEYIHRLAKQLRRKPNHDDLVESARLAGNPSEHHIGKVFGKPSVLMELAGFVNVKEWSTNDYIDWGVVFMHANNGLMPTSRHLRYVSANTRKIGPGTDAIYDHEDFSSILDFQTQVAEAYEQQVLLNAHRRKMLIEWAELEAEANPLLRGMLDQVTEGEDETLVQVAAKYALVSFFLPDAAATTVRDVTLMKKPIYLVDKIMRLNPKISLADIETYAAANGLTDYIWPVDYSRHPLNVSNWTEV